MARRFRPNRDGLLVRLHEDELELLRHMPEELRELLASKGADDDDAITARLFPRAYLDPTEEAAEQDWSEIVVPDLLKDRLAALELVTATLQRARPAKREMFDVVLNDDEVSAWLGVLNDLRLALGSRLGIADDTDYTNLDPEDPATPALRIYAWLTWFQGDLVETLLR